MDQEFVQESVANKKEKKNVSLLVLPQCAASLNLVFEVAQYTFK